MVQANLSEIPQLKFIRVKKSETIDVFDCGDADLNDFILHKASLFDRNLLAVSYAFVDEEDYGKIYAYCSLANDKIAITDFENKTEFNRFRKMQGFPNEKRLKSYPAVKLCRLGVMNQAKNKRIGTKVLNYLKTMFITNNRTGCRFITVDAYINAIPFYAKNGFQMLNSDDDEREPTRLMYFDLMDLVG